MTSIAERHQHLDAQSAVANSSGICRPGKRNCAITIVALLAVGAILDVGAVAQPTTESPTPVVIECPPDDSKLANPPEITRDDSTGVLSGTIYLLDEHQRLPTSVSGKVTCRELRVRVFKPSENSPPGPIDPTPGPTLRARAGDLVNLTLVNKVDPSLFGPNFDLNSCMRGPKYPTVPGTTEPFDVYPNCLHASSTANLHFHGTHTTPNGTGDNVYLQIRPLPRDNQGNLTTTPSEATALFAKFYADCASQLQGAPLKPWPAAWSDLSAPRWTDKQTELLKAFQQSNPTQPLWDHNKTALESGAWPQYYVGAFPYCFSLPAYAAETWPPPSGNPIMGQSPGTHWYHAHKHGSTAINVANGMTGVFIIEGQYDDDLNAAYGGYTLKDNKTWNTRSQPILVMNQLGTTPNALVGSGDTELDFVVNGRIRPRLQMQPGEIQLWRIANTSGRSAAYFVVPEGLEWRQLAQDGVQFDTANYSYSHNRPHYVAPGNRVDLLVRVPITARDGARIEVRVQNVMARSLLRPAPMRPGSPLEGTVLFTVEISGPPVTRGGQPSQMEFLGDAPRQPAFLRDITDAEWKNSSYTTKTLVFDSKAPQTKAQHTINGIQFADPHSQVNVFLGAVEEWTVTNTSTGIDHPFHIHINPFQITEVFDPNELVTDATGNLVGLEQGGRTVPMQRYVTREADIVDSSRQCLLKADDPGTWKPCKEDANRPKKKVWHDLFAIPSGRTVGNVMIPGRFKMRSRFVDFPGLYVMHCHILIHEDRGMMFSVEVTGQKPSAVRHHH